MRLFPDLTNQIGAAPVIRAFLIRITFFMNVSPFLVASVESLLIAAATAAN
jgi:hypothetical protein